MTSNINDRTNIFGMSKIYSLGDVDNNVDASQVESEFLKSYLGVKENTYSASNAYQSNLKQLESYSLGNYGDPNSDLQLDQRSVIGTPNKNFMPPNTNDSPQNSAMRNRMPQSPSREGYSPSSDRYSPSRERTFDQVRYGAPAKTEDERISHTLHEMLDGSNNGSSIIPLVTEDDREELLENCSSLRDELKEIGMNVSNIPEPNNSMSRDELEKIYRRLRIKNDRKRATSTAEEPSLFFK